jgi:hypothetical protein
VAIVKSVVTCGSPVRHRRRGTQITRVLDNIIQTDVQTSGFSPVEQGETKRLIGDVHDWGHIRANAAHQFDANTEASGHSHMAGNSHANYGGTVYHGAD